MILPIGTKVRWSKKIGPSKKFNTGMITYILNKFDKPKDVAKNLFPTHKIRFENIKIPNNVHYCYLIEKIGKTGKFLYMPHPKDVEEIKRGQKNI